MKRLVLLSFLLLSCTQTLSQDDCVRYRDRLRAWAEQKKGKQDPKAIDEFMKSCAGTTVTKNTAKCLDNAGDEASFFACLQ